MQLFPHQTKPDLVREKLLLRAANQQFYNASPLALGTLSDTQTAADLMSYVQAFSTDAREIFEHFHFAENVPTLRRCHDALDAPASSPL